MSERTITVEMFDDEGELDGYAPAMDALAPDASAGEMFEDNGVAVVEVTEDRLMILRSQGATLEEDSEKVWATAAAVGWRVRLKRAWGGGALYESFQAVPRELVNKLLPLVAGASR